MPQSLKQYATFPLEASGTTETVVILLDQVPTWRIEGTVLALTLLSVNVPANVELLSPALNPS